MGGVLIDQVETLGPFGDNVHGAGLPYYAKGRKRLLIVVRGGVRFSGSGRLGIARQRVRLFEEWVHFGPVGGRRLQRHCGLPIDAGVENRVAAGRPSGLLEGVQVLWGNV